MKREEGGSLTVWFQVGRQGSIDLVAVAGEFCGLSAPGSSCCTFTMECAQWRAMHGRQLICLTREPCTVPALSFPFLLNDLKPNQRFLFQFSSFAFCICLCFTITVEGLYILSFSYFRSRNGLHILAVVHSLI